MSAGMLGTVPREVEASLDRALGLCKLWNAMLLLDEADVFLGARTNTDLAGTSWSQVIFSPNS